MQHNDSFWGIEEGIEPDLPNLDLSMVGYSYDFHQIMGESSNASHQVYASDLAMSMTLVTKVTFFKSFLPSHRELSVSHFYRGTFSLLNRIKLPFLLLFSEVCNIQGVFSEDIGSCFFSLVAVFLVSNYGT